MAFNELETRRIKKIVGAFIEAHRPPPPGRAQLDLAYRVSGQSVEIFELRTRLRGAPGEIMEESIAKASFVKRQNHWRVYWMRADLKWHRYPPDPEVHNIEAFLDLVDKDEYACFFG